MKFYRIRALIIRHLYLYQRSVPRLMDIFFWPVMELLVWGFLSLYLQKNNLAGLNVITILLGAIIFWDLLSQSQRAVSTAFLEDVWEKNFLNIFITPLKISEFLTSTVLIGLIRIIIVAAVVGVLSFVLYGFNILIFGLYLVPFVFNLLIFGWILGLFTTAIILRYGTQAQVLAFGFIFLIQPFSAVFYPVSILPSAVQWLAYALPSTYVFEGMRAVAASGSFSWQLFYYSLGANVVYFILTLWLFYATLAYVKEKGLLLKLDQ